MFFCIQLSRPSAAGLLFAVKETNDGNWVCSSVVMTLKPEEEGALLCAEPIAQDNTAVDRQSNFFIKKCILGTF